jgi:hypothetical protein
VVIVDLAQVDLVASKAVTVITQHRRKTFSVDYLMDNSERLLNADITSHFPWKLY